MASSAHKIAESSNDVLKNAELTLETHDIVGHRIAALIDHTQRINELLELIKNVSNKSEILALNAALEGVKAGEAGRGFSLVAAQMQRQQAAQFRQQHRIPESKRQPIVRPWGQAPGVQHGGAHRGPRR